MVTSNLSPDLASEASWMINFSAVVSNFAAALLSVSFLMVSPAESKTIFAVPSRRIEGVCLTSPRTYLCTGMRHGQRGQNADFGQNDRPTNFQDAPAGLGQNAGGNARKFVDDRKFITSARNGKERALCRPIRYWRIFRQPGNCEAFR